MVIIFKKITIKMIEYAKHENINNDNIYELANIFLDKEQKDRKKIGQDINDQFD